MMVSKISRASSPDFLAQGLSLNATFFLRSWSRDLISKEKSDEAKS